MKFTKWAPIAVLFLTYPICPARSESISGALVRAYVTNPDINQQRAATRASDENVSKAVAGYRPQAAVTASLGYNYINSVQTGQIIKGNSFPTNAGVTVTQNLFNGFQTMNGVRQAESNVYQAREATRYTVQNTLQNGATFFMNVLRDAAILELNKNNIVVLEAQLRVTRNRFLLGELTRTDVAQAESSLATARSNYLVAQTNLQNSAASYRQVFGVEPNRLEPARPLDILLPGTLDQAIAISFDQHPAIRAALHNADAAALQVKVNEGQLYPTLSIVGSVAQSNQTSGISADRELNASLIGQLSVPLYSGGATSALIRQSKELLAQALFQADVQRETVRAALVSAWGQLKTAKAVINSSQAAVRAAEIALNGIRDEAKVGQRTTFDVLQAQQTVVSARVSLVSAQRDRVVASYNVLAATGQLSPEKLGLDVAVYDPVVHLEQVKDKWIGLRTPNGQ